MSKEKVTQRDVDRSRLLTLIEACRLGYVSRQNGRTLAEAIRDVKDAHREGNKMQNVRPR